MHWPPGGNTEHGHPCSPMLPTQHAHPCWVGIISLDEDLMRTKRQRKSKCAALLEPGPIFSCPSPESQTFRPGLGFRPLATPSSQAFEFVLDLPTSFPGPPACRPQIMDFSVSVIMSILRINLLYTYPVGSISLKIWLLQGPRFLIKFQDGSIFFPYLLMENSLPKSHSLALRSCCGKIFPK